jgi:3'-5' exoribonuclease
MILSHHGQLEFGSPKLPQFPEALLLHYLDDMDSKMECMRSLIENDRQVEGSFTAWNTALERAALKKDRYLIGEAPGPEGTPEGALPGPEGAPPGPEGTPQGPEGAPAESPFADKLRQALGPAEAKPES